MLVLDDTLSALDIHTEALVEEALQRVLVGVTGLVVAHRASTVLLADRVAMLSGGTLTHIGTHAELLATVPQYRELLSAEYDRGGAGMSLLIGRADSAGRARPATGPRAGARESRIGAGSPPSTTTSSPTGPAAS